MPPRQDAPRTPTRVIVLVATLLLVLLAGGSLVAWWLLAPTRPAEPTPTPTPSATGTTPTPTPTPTGSARPVTELLPDQSERPPARTLEDFEGSWTGEQPSSDILVIRLEGETLVADIPQEKAQMRLSRLQPGDAVLHGSYSREEGESIPLTAELSADGKRLTLTLAPPQSEFERVVLVRAEIEGIEAIDRSDPAAYLPLMDLQLTCRVHYPDGDSGSTRVVATQLGDEHARSMLEVGTSELYPGEPHAHVVHFDLRKDGLHRLDGDQDRLWLPARVVPGAEWTTEGWKCRVKADRVPLDLGFLQLECLVVERSNDEVQASETVWLAPGYGQVLVKDGGAEAWRLTATELLSPDEAARQVREQLP